MKTRLLVVLFAIFAFTINSNAQFSFGVSPGLSLNSAYFGYKVNSRIVPYVGFQFLNASYDLEESGDKYDVDLNKIISYSELSEFSGNLYIPNIGVKYFIKENNKLKAFLSINLSKPILSGKLKNDGEDDEDFKYGVDHISMWGGEFGFGVEYFFDENFSIGGEYGFRYLHLNYQDKYETSIFDPNTGNYKNTEIQTEYKFNMSPTYSKISLNYYF